MSTADPSQLSADHSDPEFTGADEAGHEENPSETGPSPNWRWFWLALFVVAAPLLVPYLMGIWQNPIYKYFPFAIATTAYLAYTRSDGRFFPPRGWICWGAIGFGLLLIVAASILQFTLFACIAFVLFASAMLYTMRGPMDASLLIVSLPLFTLIQLRRVDALLVKYLQRLTTWMSSVLLDAVTVPHAVKNNVIQLADRELFVAEACSGVQSVFTLGFLACGLIAFRRRRIWMTPLYLVIACLLALFSNVLRVTTVAVAATWFDADLATGWPHDLLGYFALAIAFAFLLSFDYVIATVLHRVPEESEFNPLVIAWNYFALRPDFEQGARGLSYADLESIDGDRQSGPVRWAHEWINWRPAQIVFGCLALAIFGFATAQVVRSRRPVTLADSSSALVFDPAPSILDGALSKLTVVSHTPDRTPGNAFGANTDIWECEWEDVTVQLVLSQPYQGWHELCDCYQRLEWTQLDRDIRVPDELELVEIESSNPDALNTTYVVARFRRESMQHGYLIFSGIGSDGTLVDAPDSLTAFTHRVWNRIDTTGVWDQTEVIMLQMWVASPDRLKPRRLEQLEREFLAARARFAEQIAENAGRKLPAAPPAKQTEDIPVAANGRAIPLTQVSEPTSREVR